MTSTDGLRDSLGRTETTRPSQALVAVVAPAHVAEWRRRDARRAPRARRRRARRAMTPRSTTSNARPNAHRARPMTYVVEISLVIFARVFSRARATEDRFRRARRPRDGAIARAKTRCDRDTYGAYVSRVSRAGFGVARVAISVIRQRAEPDYPARASRARRRRVGARG